MLDRAWGDVEVFRLSTAGVYVGLYGGVHNLFLRRRRCQRGELPQGRLQHFLPIEDAHFLRSLCGAHDPGEQAAATIDGAIARGPSGMFDGFFCRPFLDS